MDYNPVRWKNKVYFQTKEIHVLGIHSELTESLEDVKI